MAVFLRSRRPPAGRGSARVRTRNCPGWPGTADRRTRRCSAPVRRCVRRGRSVLRWPQTTDRPGIRPVPAIAGHHGGGHRIDPRPPRRCRHYTGFGRHHRLLPHYHYLRPRPPPNVAAAGTADLGTTHPGRSCRRRGTGGRVMTGWLRRSREPGARVVRNPARPAAGRIARGGAGAVAAAGMLSGFWLLPPASSAQIAGAGHPRGGAVEWAGFAANARHTAVARKRPQPFRQIRWRAKVDLAPAVIFGELLIHYGSPMITAANTVLVPTRISAKAGFRIVAYSGTSGARRWSLNTDYRPPAFTGGPGIWTPPLPAVLTPTTALAVAGAGGTVLVRKHANMTHGAVRRLVFYGAAQWKAHRSTYDKAVQITTPLTAGPDGSVYFGFTVTGATPAHLSSGIARIDA